MDLIPIFDYQVNFVVMTWTGQEGIFELIINGVLQSRVAGIEKNGTISGQSRFIVGGSEFEERNLVGIIHNFNVWDKVIVQFFQSLTALYYAGLHYIKHVLSVTLYINWGHSIKSVLIA